MLPKIVIGKMIFPLLKNHMIFLSLFYIYAEPSQAIEVELLDTNNSDETIIGGKLMEHLNKNVQSDTFSLHNLTEEEEQIANEARKEIANAMEKNIVRLFAVITSRGNRFGRQDEDAEEEAVDAAATPNPNVLPQVAQILGAIFSNNLNLTRIVDQTFGLVPNVVRMQLMGIVKLLTGQDIGGELSTTTEESEREIIVSTMKTSQVSTSSSPEISSNDPSLVENTVPVASTPFASVKFTTTPKQRYRIKSRTTTAEPTTQLSSGSEKSVPVLEDDELERYEKDLRAVAKIYEPLMKDKSPRFYVGPFRDILNTVNFNSTEIIRAVPSIFKGARRAFLVLESLGVLPDFVDDLSSNDE